jgi:hypothetical protein
MCFSAVRGKPCPKATLAGDKKCRFAHSTQELQARIDSLQEAERAAARKKE